jgi:hypothetical protein
MKRLSILLPFCILVTTAHAAERHEWYVLKAHDGAYAFDTESVETEMGSGVKSISILVGTRAGHTDAEYDVDCDKNQGVLASSVADDAKPTDIAWSAVPKSGSMKVAADVACGRSVAGAIRVKSEQAALAKLKILSK